MAARLDRVGLRPERFVERARERLTATDLEPWLALEIDAAPLAGRFVEIVYRSSFWDEPVRPVFRFHTPGGDLDRIGAGPIAGRSSWIGRIPTGTTRISVSPTNRTGPFDFEIERIARRSWSALFVRGLLWNRRSARSAVLTKLIGWGPESDVNLAWATGSMPMSTYPRWLRTHARRPEPAGIDRPRFDWSQAVPITIVIGGRGAVEDTLASLQAQLFPSWRALLLDADVVGRDARVSAASAQTVDALVADLPLGSLCARLDAGDRLLPTALAIVAEQAWRAPAARLFYGDVLAEGGARPVFKPGWSPRLQTGRSFLDRPVFIRDPGSVHVEARRRALFDRDLGPMVGALAPSEIVAVRRMLAIAGAAAVPAVAPATVVPPRAGATATIIVPTKDHPALLGRLVDSIRKRPGRYEIVVVDNASASPDTLALLETLRGASGMRVRSDPRSFNFSRLCNEAAATSCADVLVFLNDDMEVRSDDWLERLVVHALDPSIGAVGARLTYPDGRLQHVGVLVGMGESAGHFGALADASDPGWAGRNTTLHEVSAVTGACLAVARDKFEAVGGFDAEALPIELSDIDLCLKLNARGWQTVVDPAVHLMHEESASRGGATFRRLDVHDRERAIFVERWRHVIRDDPFFHPGLSLYRWEAALG